MPRKTLVLNQFLGINNVKDSRDIADSQVTSSKNLMFDKQGALRTAGKFVAMPESGLSGNTGYMGAGNGLFYIESDRALSASSSHNMPVYNGNYGQFYQASSGGVPAQVRFEGSTFDNNFSVGDKIKITGSSVSGTNVIKTVTGVGSYSFPHMQGHIDVSGSWGSTGSSSTQITVTKVPRDGENIWIKPKSNSTTTAANREIKIWNSLENTWAAPGIKPTGSNDSINGDFLPRYYYADLALRVSDTNFSNASRIKWYGFIERNHFGNNPYLGWEVKNNTLATPTYGKDASSYPTTAGQINWSCAPAAPGTNEAESTWVEGSYELAVSHIYDGVQESKLYSFQNSTEDENQFTIASGNHVAITARVLAPFDSRISGSRLYCRSRGPEIGESDEEWSFLAEVDFEKGIKTSLSSDYKVSSTNYAWHGTSTVNQYYSETSTSVRQNTDTYESINGFSSDIEAISLGDIGDGWKLSCVANRRVFLANIKIQEGDDAKTYGDRIMYSEIGKYDTFPSYNFIDVVKGDAEVYTALVEYGDRLLAFKNNTLFILNVANPSPTAWFLEKTFRHKGVKHAEAVFRSEDGVIWVNEAGCWVYDGKNIRNLIDDTLDPIQNHSSSPEYELSWRDFYTIDSIVGYSPKYKQILVLSKCSSTSAKTVYCFDLRTKSWALLTDSTDFFSTSEYSNFILDGNGDLAIMTDGGVIRKYSPVSSSKPGDSIELITKYIDFGLPNNMKKIYKIAVTYKSTATQANILRCRYIDKNGTMQNSTFSSNLFDDLTLAAHTNWGIAVYEPTSALQCQSIQFKIKPPSTGTIDINEIMVYYRAKKTIVKSGV